LLVYISDDNDRIKIESASFGKPRVKSLHRRKKGIALYDDTQDSIHNRTFQYTAIRY